jgi:hypothetical protein
LRSRASTSKSLLGIRHNSNEKTLIDLKYSPNSSVAKNTDLDLYRVKKMMSAPERQPPQSYSQDEIQQILHLAITRQSDREELSREQLWEIAAELEISSESIQAAEQDWLDRKLIDQKRQAFDRYRREQFQQKVVKYLIVNAFLVALDVLTAGAISWSRIILLLWGLLLSLEAWKTFQLKGEAYEQAFQRWLLKNEMKQSLTTLWNRIKRAWQS